ncbi:MAG: single-stranded-DNA-specific exonuclease RecJ [Candidatus Niyogibacteria bacterium]|nr:single-stranded-DNA-specific exonuclease RecJ [Candidatus Niyogibacteria bacterium]
MANTKKWILKKSYPASLIKKFPDEDEISRQMLFERGLKTREAGNKYFFPDYERDLHDPFQHKDMKKAAQRIIRAIKEEEKTVIFGDYDADGMCGAAIFSDFFKKIGFANFEVHIPDRYQEGYGLSQKAVEKFIGLKPALVVMVDCGVTNFQEIKKLHSYNIEVIVIDHHLTPSKLPEAYAIIDAKREDDDYPYKYLCGAGEAFKTIQAILKIESFGLPLGWEKWLLDLVGIAIIADMMPLTDENRALVYYGLRVAQKTKRPGLLALYRKLNLNPSLITEEDIAFSVAPHINAAGRMGRETTSFDLLITSSLTEAEWLVEKICQTKEEQRRLVDKIIQDVKSKYQDLDNLPPAIAMGDLSWNPGVLGLSANRLLEFFSRPVFLWGKGEISGNIKGSARSADLNVMEIMRGLPDDFFIDFGGHHFAGGFSVSLEKIAEFEKKINEIVSKKSRDKNHFLKIEADKELDIEKVNSHLFENIRRFAPFGAENPAPIFWFKNLELKHLTAMGNSGLHLKLFFRKSNGEELTAVLWFKGERPELQNLTAGSKLELLATIELSRYNGRKELRLGVADYRIL